MVANIVHIFLLLSLVPVFVNLCSQMEEHQNVRPSTGTNEWNQSYYMGNSLSALHSFQQFHDDTVSMSVQPLVFTQATNGTTSSGFVSGPQSPHGLIRSHVPAGPTRNVAGEAMPTSLAEGRHTALIPLVLAALQPLDCSSSAASATSPHFTPGRCCADDSTQ